MKFFNLRTAATAGVTTASFVLVALLWFRFANIETTRLHAESHAATLSYLSTKRAEIEQLINRRLFAVRGLMVMVRNNPGFTQKDFETTAQALLEGQEGIKALQLAPKGIILYIYPMEGNEAAFGRNLLTDPERGPAARRAMETRQFFLAGPFQLYQGGLGLVGRIPMYTDTVFWGFAQVVLDYAAVLANAGLMDTTGLYEFAIRGLDELGDEGAVIFGRSEVFDENPERARIALASGSWQIAAIPKGGWETRTRLSNLFWLSGAVIALLAAMLVSVAMRRWYRMQSELESSRDVWRFALEGAGDGVWDWKIPTDEVTYSKRWKEMIGYAEDEIPNRTDEWQVRVHPDDLSKTRSVLDRCICGEIDSYFAEFRMRCKDGSYKWVLGRGKVISFMPDGKPLRMIGTHTDITKLRMAEDALRESEGRYRTLFENDLTGDFVASQEGAILSCNPAFAKIFGFSSASAATGVSLVSLFMNEKQGRQLMKQVLDLQKLEYVEFTMQRLDEIPVYVVMNLTGKFDKGSGMVRIIGFVFDDTRRRLAEQRLLQAQKMESIGTLAGGIAHDFNNLLGIILGHGSVLAQRPDPERVHRSAAIIVQTAERGASLVRQILTFARKTDLKVKLVRVNQLIGDLAQLLGETFPKTIALSLQLEKALPAIEIDETQLHQALLNLCMNARDAMDGKGTLTISTSLVEGKTVPAQYVAAPGQAFVKISVADSGVGMDEATKERMFEPFFTTKREKGTGLGLAVVYGIVHQHNGCIDVQSTLGTGTGITMYFPAASAAPAPSGEKAAQLTDLVRGTERVLLVEDEAMILDLHFSALTANGYRVDRARDGGEGIQLFREHLNEIDAVVTDLGMPRVNGIEVVAEVRRLAPLIPILVISGFLEPEIRTKLEQFGVSGILPKPFTPADLLRQIRNVLDDRKTG